MWCGPCQALAGEAQDLQDEYGPSGFQMIEVLIEDTSGNNLDQAELMLWDSNFGLDTVPVLDDDRYRTWVEFEQDWAIPTVVHIGPGMEVLSVDEGIHDPARWL
jgi:thiol-disulfide isomerase/thioredoxin